MGEHTDPDAARVGRKLEGGYAPNLVEEVVMVLASSTAVAYGPRSARRSQTWIPNLKAMIRVYIVRVKDKVNQVQRTLASASKLRLRTGSFRLPIWRRPIFNSDFLGMSVAGETGGGHVLDVWPSTELRSGNWTAATVTAVRWESAN